MPVLFGKRYTKAELLARVGDVSQVGGVRPVRLAGGKGDGVEAVDFRTGSGLHFVAVPGRGLDITIAEHNGMPFSWRSATGEADARFFDEPGLCWLRNFPGGLVTTCGLTNAGAPCVDQGEALGLHGRVSNTPASNVWTDGEWEGDNYRMWVQGKMRESRLFGENIVLKRRVSAMLGESKIWIDDVVTNEGPRQTPHMFLYHINGGWPAIDGGSVFVSPTRSATPRDTDAEVDKEHYYLMEPPTPGFKERCYYHDMASDPDGFVYTALINKNLPDGRQFGFYVKYNKNELPLFTQWKQNGAQEYVCGMEPANCRVEGRSVDREAGRLQFLEPGESREYHIELGVLATPVEVAEFEDKVKSLKA
ncbi:MAG: aldose 1-epimerase family protein [Armatimonadota bacterium]|nr:aldose 1-epimerase family protein [bacterium]